MACAPSGHESKTPWSRLIPDPVKHDHRVRLAISTHPGHYDAQGMEPPPVQPDVASPRRARDRRVAPERRRSAERAAPAE